MILKRLTNLNELFDFSKLTGDHSKFKIKNEKFVGNFETETPKNLLNDELVWLRGKESS